MNFENMVFILPLFLHCFGIFVLFKIRKKKISNRSQYACMCCLCAVEILISLAFIITPLNISTKARLFINIFKDGVLMNWFLFVMIILTLDRFMEVFLNIRYRVLWKPRKTKFCLLLTLVISVILTAIVYWQSLADIQKLFPKYITLYTWSILTTIAVLFVIVTYTYFMVKIYTHPKRKTSTEKRILQSLQRDNKRSLVARIKCKIYIPTLLILSFILFCVIPDQVYLYYVVKEEKLPDITLKYIIVSHALEFTVDAFIYIIASKVSRQFIRKSFLDGRESHELSSCRSNVVINNIHG